ncbi:hypothetical protein [Chryseolinea lacunae]|uniref:Uncharacterized protein n=1 Tax=Chryseolinea lacunae TaxID=2801331 RepID=A0ABS1KYR6_9BACT|nr:hypothetical protein [Chryseolinea lacunae]MBL0744600.1 hypothetical protein [Chryseolinea lacunae]
MARIYIVPPFTEYPASAYDAKKNPFMMLADAVRQSRIFSRGQNGELSGGGL